MKTNKTKNYFSALSTLNSNMVDAKPLVKNTGANDWDVHVFECFENPIMCLWAWLVPCGTPIMQAVIMKLITRDDNQIFITILLDCLFGCFGSGYARTKIREEFNINGNYLLDCCLWMWLPCCSGVQEWRQAMLKFKGDSKRTIINYSD